MADMADGPSVKNKEKLKIEDIVLFPGSLEELNKINNYYSLTDTLVVRSLGPFNLPQAEAYFRKILLEQNFVGVIRYTLTPYTKGTMFEGSNDTKYICQGVPIKFKQ